MNLRRTGGTPQVFILNKRQTFFSFISLQPLSKKERFFFSNFEKNLAAVVVEEVEQFLSENCLSFLPFLSLLFLSLSIYISLSLFSFSLYLCLSFCLSHTSSFTLSSNAFYCYHIINTKAQAKDTHAHMQTPSIVPRHTHMLTHTHNTPIYSHLQSKSTYI